MPSPNAALPPRRGFLASDDLGALFGGRPAPSAAFYGVSTTAPRTRCSSSKGQDSAAGPRVQSTGSCPPRPVLLTAQSSSISRTRPPCWAGPWGVSPHLANCCAPMKTDALRRKPTGGRLGPASLTWRPHSSLALRHATPQCTGHLSGPQVLIVSEGSVVDYSHQPPESPGAYYTFRVQRSTPPRQARPQASGGL